MDTFLLVKFGALQKHQRIMQQGTLIVVGVIRIVLQCKVKKKRAHRLVNDTARDNNYLRFTELFNSTLFPPVQWRKHNLQQHVRNVLLSGRNFCCICVVLGFKSPAHANDDVEHRARERSLL